MKVIPFSEKINRFENIAELFSQNGLLNTPSEFKCPPPATPDTHIHTPTGLLLLGTELLLGAYILQLELRILLCLDK